jgi:hypothetical protein
MHRPFESITNGDWHTVGLAWEKDLLTFYVNGKVTWKTIDGGISDVPEFILLTLDAGWIDYPPTPGKLPDYAYVDWVKVYTKK